MTYSSRRKEVDMKKVIMIIAVAAILVGCKGKGTRVQISDSVDKFKVEKLFVVDSITVYRFYDNGNAIYFTNRKGRVDATHSEYNPLLIHTLTRLTKLYVKETEKWKRD